MQELLNKRQYQSKTFLNDDGTFTLESHGGHIHYKDKLGDGEMKPIDFTLNWDDTKRGWGFDLHSFRPFLPEYADEWVEFRDLFDGKDQTIRYKAKCDHIKGRLVDPMDIGLDKETSVNCVIYDDAFGRGYDYILYFSRSSLKKVVRIRDEFKDVKDDLAFDFEVEFPKDDTAKEVDVIRAESKAQPIEAGKAYKLDLTTAKEFDTAKLTLIGNDKNDGHEWFTYLRSFVAWDSGDFGKRETIKVQYFIADGKKFLRKIITKDLLSRSVGDVFTDTTTTYYAGNGDGFCDTSGLSSSWSTNHAATASPAGRALYGDTQLRAFSYGDSSKLIQRCFIPINTTDLPSGSSVTAATLGLRVTATVYDNDNDGDDWLNVVQTTTASSTTLTEEDFDQCGTVTNPTEGCDTRVDISGVSTGTTITFDLNSTGRGWIVPGGYTKLGIREGHDCLNHEPTANYTGCYFVQSEDNGAYDPYLSVTYSEGGAKPQINISDVWKQSTDIQINIGDSWRPVTKMQINVSDTWKSIF